MFSHAFESIGKKLNLVMARHEHVSDLLIRGGEINEAFLEMGSGFANDVAAVIKRGRPGNLYDAVVSSHFDADRLDYMQRDRLMTGLQNGGIDFTWLMANLEVGRIKTGVDQETVGEVDTFVLGPKALYAAEAYVLALFQLYPTIYFHKATRAAEKLFSALILQIISLVREGHANKIGLPKSHPLIRFASAPNLLDNALALDDAVFWGALPMLSEARDLQLRELAVRIRDRRLSKCTDVRARIVSAIGLGVTTDSKKREQLKKRLERLVISIESKLERWSELHSNDMPRILTDRAIRDPYKRFEESTGLLNQILIRLTDRKIIDVASCSSFIRAIESFELFRAYTDDDEAKRFVDSTVEDELRRS